jgi:hypothetical protein
MNKGAFYITTILLIISLKSWGSVPLPQLLTDTIPVKRPEEVVQKQDQPVKELTDPVIKEVPRAKKQLKPIAVPPTVVPVKVPQIIKPKIVIRRIGVRI